MKRAGLTLRRGALLVLLTLLLCVGAFAEKAPAEPSATEQLEAALAEALPARQTVVEVASDGLEQYADEQLLVDLLREMAAKSADDPEAGLDYDVLNIHALYTRVENGVLRVTLEYLTTAEQEQAVDEACVKIRADLQLDGKTETERVLELYEYVGTHFVYDDTLQIFSAYEGLRQGKMVCQGYAILLYKLLWQEQIPCRIVTGYAGEAYLKRTYPGARGIVLCSNYLGYLLDCAAELGIRQVLLAGRPGKLIKPAANIMYLHSHTAGGQREIVCTHAALAGADQGQIRQLYACNTTREMQDALEAFGLAEPVWQSIAESACENCTARTRGAVETGLLLLDEEDRILAASRQAETIRKAWWNCGTN